MTDWSFDYAPGSSTTTNTTTLSLDLPLGALWYAAPRVIETRRKRSLVLPVAIGHAAFFLALALAGWLR